MGLGQGFTEPIVPKGPVTKQVFLSFGLILHRHLEKFSRVPSPAQE